MHVTDEGLAARAQNSPKLAHDGLEVFDVRERQRASDQVDGFVGDGELLEATGAELRGRYLVAGDR